MLESVADQGPNTLQGSSVGEGGPELRSRIAVGIATAGRTAILREMLISLRDQTRPPDLVVVSAPTLADVEGAADAYPGVVLHLGMRGLTIQRNVILDACATCQVVVFFDDDFFPDREYLRRLETVHEDHPEVAMVTGAVLLDGVTSGGIPVEIARTALRETVSVEATPSLTDVYNGYGCNMSVRVALAARYGLRFDERLPLYGWLEDVDFSRSLARYGRVVRSEELRGVHLGNKAGRQPGKRLGYSQIANPIYIYRKGNLSLRRAFLQIARNCAANVVHLARPEPFVDRRGRVLGNLRGFLELVTGRLRPDRALLM